MHMLRMRSNTTYDVLVPYYLGWPVITVSLHWTYLLLAVLGEKEEIETGGQRTTMAPSLPLRTPYWYYCFDQTESSDHRRAQLQRPHPKMEYYILRTHIWETEGPRLHHCSLRRGYVRLRPPGRRRRQRLGPKDPQNMLLGYCVVRDTAYSNV